MNSIKKMRKIIYKTIDKERENENNNLELKQFLDVLDDIISPRLEPRIQSIIESRPNNMKHVKSSSDLIVHLKNEYKLKIGQNTENEIYYLLESVGYYKFSGYRRPFMKNFGLEGREWQGHFEEDVDCRDIIKLIDFDRELSTILFTYLKTIEKRIKQRGTYFVTKYYADSLPHLNIDNFEDTEKWIDYININYYPLISGAEQNNDHPIIHHKKKYSGNIPLWIFFEKITFGAFQFFFSSLNQNDKVLLRKEIYHSSLFYTDISKYVEQKRFDDMVTIIRMIRNRVMHYGRLYDIEYLYKLPRKTPVEFREKFENYIYSVQSENTKDIVYLSGIIKIMGFFLTTIEYENMVRSINFSLHNNLLNVQPKYKDRIIKLMDWEQLTKKNCP